MEAAKKLFSYWQWDVFLICWKNPIAIKLEGGGPGGG